MKVRAGLCVLLVLCLLRFKVAATSAKPHIIVIVADDLGWNDVSFHGSNQIPTPNIDALAYNGVILNSHYTQTLCTPSRAAFLTGKYPIHTGMQHLVILEPEPWGLPLKEKLMPQYLKEAGYATHAVGKWHLGFFRQEYTPTYRGFDTHYGYWNGFQDYYTHDVKATFNANMSGYDMRRDMAIDYSARGKYSTEIFTDEAIKLIRQHDAEKPMFMYLAHLAPHTGNRDNPLQAPDEEVAKFAHIADPERRIYAAMVSMLDKSIGQVLAALREKNMLENSIVLFMSDNGAPSFDVHGNFGSNYPMRGMKNSPWDGGMRAAACIWSPLLKKVKRVSDQLIHIADWLPTFLSAAGIDTTQLENIDGIDMWKSISENVTSPRTEMLYNIDDIENYAAIRRGDFKYVIGTTVKGRFDQWYGDSGKSAANYDFTEADVLKSQTASVLAGVITAQQIHEKQMKEGEGSSDTTNFSATLLTKETIKTLRKEAQLHCGEHNEDETSHVKCNPLESPCLFNIREDPCEKINIATLRPMVLLSLENALIRYKKNIMEPQNVPEDANADPRKWNNTWVPWQDCEDIQRKHIGSHTTYMSPTGIAVLATLCILFFAVMLVLIAISVKSKINVKNVNSDSSILSDDNLDAPTSVIHVKTETPGESFEDNEIRRQNSVKHIPKSID